MGVFEEASHRQHVGASVHHHEEERSGQIEPRHAWVVLHHQVQQEGDLLHQNGVKGQEELGEKNRQNIDGFYLRVLWIRK